MTKYKRGILSLIIGIVGSHFAALIIGLILEYFIPIKIAFIIALIAYLTMMYLTIFSDNIEFVVNDDSHSLTYYQNKKFIKEYNLKGAKLGYDITTKKNQGATKINLKIDEDIIDCEPLGQTKFYKMFEHLESLAESEVEKIEVTRTKE